MKRWAKELALLGVTLVFIACAFAGYFYAGLASHIDALPVPGVSTGDTVKAFEPGSKKDVLKYCQTAKQVRIVQKPGAEVLGVIREAWNSDLDYLEWKDYQSNTAATWHYADKGGQNATEKVNVVTKLLIMPEMLSPTTTGEPLGCTATQFQKAPTGPAPSEMGLNGSGINTPDAALTMNTLSVLSPLLMTYRRFFT